jgi:DNA replication factor GINS
MSNTVMDGDIAIKDAYSMLQKEIEDPSLQPIDPDTYQRIAASLGNLKGQGFEGVEAKVRDRMVELLSTCARLLIEVRQRKARAGDEPLDYSKLTDEEKYVLDGKSEAESRMVEVLAAATKGRPKVLAGIAARVRAKRILVRFVKQHEPFIGVDAAKYGPFQEEDVATLPLENARSLVEAGVAVQVHAQL